MMIHVRIVTHEGIYKEFDTPILNIRTDEGEQGILPNHMPLVTMLKIDSMESEENGKRMVYAVSGGLFYFRDNTAEILTSAIENSSEIDQERAEQAKARAEKRLASDDANIDQKRASIALARAMNRLKVASRNH